MMLRAIYFPLFSLTLRVLSLSGLSILVSANYAGAFTFDSSVTHTFGDVVVDEKGVRLTNAFVDGSDDATGNFNLSGNDPLYVADLEFELGLPDYSLDPDPDNFFSAMEGSAIATTMAVEAGDILNFNWNFFTNDSSFFPEKLGDYSFFLVNDTLTVLGDTNSFLTASPTSFTQETGWQNFSHTFLTKGNYTIGFGVVDAIDSRNTSSLAIEEIQLTRSRSIPESSTTVGMLAIAGWGISTLRRKVG